MKIIDKGGNAKWRADYSCNTFINNRRGYLNIGFNVKIIAFLMKFKGGEMNIDIHKNMGIGLKESSVLGTDRYPIFTGTLYKRSQLYRAQKWDSCGTIVFVQLMPIFGLV